MYDIIASIVAFKNKKDVLAKAIDSFLGTGLKIDLYVIDNSPTEELKSVCISRRANYIFTNNNLGFGAAHNIAIRKMMGRTKYSLILNPDIYFHEGTLEKLFHFMEANEDVGLVMPKVLYPDGSLQYLCRLLPHPYDMLLRRIDVKILNPLLKSRKARYEFRYADYNKLMDVPYLSGCFMFIRTGVFEKVGVFDERFFIYFEDVDLSRRIHQHCRTVYYPGASVYHGYARASTKNSTLFKHHVFSGIKYFNKWGWLLDHERSSVNNKAIQKCRVTL